MRKFLKRKNNLASEFRYRDQLLAICSKVVTAVGLVRPVKTHGAQRAAPTLGPALGIEGQLTALKPILSEARATLERAEKARHAAATSLDEAQRVVAEMHAEFPGLRLIVAAGGKSRPITAGSGRIRFVRDLPETNNGVVETPGLAEAA